MHILFLEDDSIDTGALIRGRTLDYSAHYFRYSSDLFDMLKVLKKIDQLPALIVTDMHMPVAQGADVLTRLQAYYPSVPRGVFSGVDRCDSQYADFFVSKDEGVGALMLAISAELKI